LEERSSLTVAQRAANWAEFHLGKLAFFSAIPAPAQVDGYLRGAYYLSFAMPEIWSGRVLGWLAWSAHG
jgi:hypothetical protein